MATREMVLDELSGYLAETRTEDLSSEDILDLLVRAGVTLTAPGHVHPTSDWSMPAHGPCQRLLLPHAGVWDYRACGLTAPPGGVCGAITERDRQCPKEGVVEMHALADGEERPFLLCGGHFGVHRRRAMAVLLPGGCA